MVGQELLWVMTKCWNTFVWTLEGRLDVGSMALVADSEGGTVVGEDGVLGEDMAGCFVELVVGFGVQWLGRLLECLMACWNVAS